MWFCSSSYYRVLKLSLNYLRGASHSLFKDCHHRRMHHSPSNFESKTSPSRKVRSRSGSRELINTQGLPQLKKQYLSEISRTNLGSSRPETATESCRQAS